MNTITVETITEKAKASPAGPLVLWRFRHLADTTHVNNLDLLHGMRNDHKQIDLKENRMWKVSVIGGGTGGFVALVRVELKGAILSKKSLDEYKQWWVAQLAMRGHSRPGISTHTPTRHVIKTTAG
jgi:hypothetical protein